MILVRISTKNYKNELRFVKIRAQNRKCRFFQTFSLMASSFASQSAFFSMRPGSSSFFQRIFSLSNLIQNQDFGRRKFWILKRKCRFGGFRGWRFQIWASRIEIRKELQKSILDFSKSNFWLKNQESKSNFRFWADADFWNFGRDFEFLSPNFKIEIEFQVLMFRFRNFLESKFLKTPNFKFWQNGFLYFKF